MGRSIEYLLLFSYIINFFFLDDTADYSLLKIEDYCKGDGMKIAYDILKEIDEENDNSDGDSSDDDSSDDESSDDYSSDDYSSDDDEIEEKHEDEYVQ